MGLSRANAWAMVINAGLLALALFFWLDQRPPAPAETPSAPASTGLPSPVPERVEVPQPPSPPTPSQRDPVEIPVATPEVPPTLAPAESAPPPKRRLDAERMDREELLRLVQDDEQSNRRESLEDLLAAKRAAIPEGLSGENRIAAQDAAQEIASAEFERRSLRNRLLLDLYVWRTAPEFKVGPKGVFLGQFESIERDDASIEFVMNCEQFPDYGQALSRLRGAQQTFLRAIRGK